MGRIVGGTEGISSYIRRSGPLKIRNMWYAEGERVSSKKGGKRPYTKKKGALERQISWVNQGLGGKQKNSNADPALVVLRVKEGFALKELSHTK